MPESGQSSPHPPYLPRENLILCRAYFNTVSVLKYSASLLHVLVNETLVSSHLLLRLEERTTHLINNSNAQFWGERLAELDTGGAVSYDMKPFLPDLFDHSSISSAYPPDRSTALFPTNIYFAWSSSSVDSEVAAALWLSTNTICAAAIVEGQNISDVAMYENYALIGTSAESLYGKNLPRLKSVRNEVDLNDVIALAGGFKI